MTKQRIPNIEKKFIANESKYNSLNLKMSEFKENVEIWRLYGGFHFYSSFYEY